MVRIPIVTIIIYNQPTRLGKTNSQLVNQPSLPAARWTPRSFRLRFATTARSSAGGR